MQNKRFYHKNTSCKKIYVKISTGHIQHMECLNKVSFTRFDAFKVEVVWVENILA